MTTTVETRFIVLFRDHGFYAKKQPIHEWNFTPLIEHAMQYATFKGANERGIWGLNAASCKSSYKIVKVSVTTHYSGHEETSSAEWITKEALQAAARRLRAEKRAANGEPEIISFATLLKKLPATEDQS